MMFGSNWVQMPVANNEEQEQLYLPPGFRFDPTDDEIIDRYLMKKVANPRLDTTAMGDVDLNKCEPWQLRSKAKLKEKELYFFCQKDMKYPTGTRANRATKSGYWKATGKDKEIYSFRISGNVKKRVLVGMKKTLVFYMGRAPTGEKTNWVMHEFRLVGEAVGSKITARDEWVVCRVNEKKSAKSNKTNQPAEPDTSNSNQPDETDPSNSYDHEDQDFMNFVSDPTFHDTSDMPGLTSVVASVEVEPTSATPTNMPNSSIFSGMTGLMTESNPVLLPNNFTSNEQVRVNQPWLDNHGYGNLGFIQDPGMANSMFFPMYNFDRYQ